MRHAARVFAVIAMLAGPAHGEESGRAMFVGGKGLAALVGGVRTEAPSVLACANCHGFDGLGKSEGRTIFPPVTAEALQAPNESRPTLSRADIRAAITAGRHKSGRSLDGLMPRYALSDGQFAGIYAYLETITSEQASGVTHDRVRIAIPASVEFHAQAERAAAALARSIRSAVSGGLIHGRIVDVVAISPEQAAGSDILAAVAMIADDADDASRSFEDAGLPNLFPFSPVLGHDAAPFTRGAGPGIDDAIDRLIAAAVQAGVTRLTICASAAPRDDRIAALARQRGAAAKLTARRAPLVACSAGEAEAMFVFSDTPADLFAAARNMTGGGDIYGLLDQWAPALKMGPVGKRVRLANTRPQVFDVALKRQISLIDAHAEMLAPLLVEALLKTGRRLTRSKLLDAVGVVSDKAGPLPEGGTAPSVGTSRDITIITIDASR